jgi:hypothetical protein
MNSKWMDCVEGGFLPIRYRLKNYRRASTGGLYINDKTRSLLVRYNKDITFTKYVSVYI